MRGEGGGGMTLDRVSKSLIRPLVFLLIVLAKKCRRE